MDRQKRIQIQKRPHVTQKEAEKKRALAGLKREEKLRENKSIKLNVVEEVASTPIKEALEQLRDLEKNAEPGSDDVRPLDFSSYLQETPKEDAI